MIYLENPKRKVPKGYRSWKEYMSYVSSHRKGARRRNAPNPARKTTKRKAAGRRPAGTRARSYRRNPIKMGSIVDQVMSGGIGAVEVLAGKGIARSVPSLFKIDRETTMGLIVQALAGLAAGLGAQYVLPSGAAHVIMSGGLSAPLESLIKRSGIPVISAAFGETEEEAEYIAAYPELMGAYPQSPALPAGAVMLPAAMGEDEDQIIYVQ